MATPIGSQEINEDKMNQFLGKVVGDFGAALSTSLAYVGQKLGLYKAMAEAGPSTPTELAQKTNTNERYVREWLLNQASGGYVDYDATTGKYSLAPEQAVALTDENSPFFVGGGFFVVKAMNQALLAIHIWSAGEALAALAKLGVTAQVALEVINGSSGRSNSSENLFPERVIGRKYPRTFKIALLDKDVGIAAGIVDETQTPAPFIDLAAQLFADAHKQLGEEADHVEAVRIIEEKAGVRIS